MPTLRDKTPEERARISSLGGKAAHAKGTAHKYQKGSELAREAGRKGGAACHAAKRRRRAEEAADEPEKA